MPYFIYKPYFQLIKLFG